MMNAWKPPIPPHFGPCEPDDFQGELVDVSGPVASEPFCVIPPEYWPWHAISLVAVLLKALLETGELQGSEITCAVALVDLFTAACDEDEDVGDGQWSP